MKSKTSEKPLTWETLGVETVSLPALKKARQVADIQERVQMVVPSVDEGQFVRIWSTEIQNDPRRQSFEFLTSIFENVLVAQTILAFIPGRRVEFPFQGNWGNGIGQLNPACSGELYVGRGTMQTRGSSKVETFLLGRVMDGVLYLREYHFSPEGFFEAQRGIAKVCSESEFKINLHIFSWSVDGSTKSGIVKKTCGLETIENIYNIFLSSWYKEKPAEFEIEFVKDSPVEFVLAKQVNEYLPGRFTWDTSKILNVWRPVEGSCAKSFFPEKGCIFPMIQSENDEYWGWREKLDYLKRIPIMVQGEVYIINSEFVKKQEDENEEDEYFNYGDDYVCGLEFYCRAHAKASYEKDVFVKSSLLTKRMRSIFNRRKFAPKADKLSTRSDKIRENLKLLALETGSKAKFVEELTERCKITIERAERIYDDMKIDNPTAKQVQFYYCSWTGKCKVLDGGVCHKKEGTNCSPPSSISILGPRDTNLRRRKRHKSRKRKALSKSYQANKERKNTRKKREKQRSLTRKLAREVKTSDRYDYESNLWCCGCGWCCGDWEEEDDDEESQDFCHTVEATTAKMMYDWFREVTAVSCHENHAKYRSDNLSHP